MTLQIDELAQKQFLKTRSLVQFFKKMSECFFQNVSYSQYKIGLTREKSTTTQNNLQQPMTI